MRRLTWCCLHIPALRKAALAGEVGVSIPPAAGTLFLSGPATFSTCIFLTEYRSVPDILSIAPKNREIGVLNRLTALSFSSQGLEGYN